MFSVVNAKKSGYCDGVSRRDVLKIGALGLGFGSLGLADLMRMEARAGQGSSVKSIINVHLGGGPSHQDMWDLKPDAPVEYRGEFNPTATNVPGLEICEFFPELAKMADKFSVLRGVVGSVNEHSPSTTQTGYGQKELAGIGGPPAIGSVIAKLQGYHEGTAPFVSDGVTVSPGYLGPQFKPFSPSDAVSMLQLRKIDADRLTTRANLLKSVDGMRRDSDASGQLEAADVFTQRAVDVVLSGRMADALDINKEDPAVMARYVGAAQGRMRDNERFLRARRLIEAGVRCVSMTWGGWDTHANNFDTLRTQLPALDRGLSALLGDLEDRGMLQDVVVAVWGEFGRTPRINAGAGRDHWPQVAAAFLGGGAFRHGQAIGSSDRIGGEADLRPVHVHEVLATMYHHMGINPETEQIIDPAGRPRYLLDNRQPIRELV
ncbi:DUF1501 domain-containing protein [Lignipirellula cremea]|uniref:DUF1501 domain-containing protein n=1 Tax=Lignipirellula cremea TaxID=2528010 RepID=A0A518DND9_9BACT|nr:DUF1501 domain-containing protein [Lignipirellula cremea]QDU93350.1 hypothetical protein Pla8534_11300 [Lignipirellula cremea]